MNEELRQSVRFLKVYKGLKYKEIADKAGISYNSFYCWLKGNYDFKDSRAIALKALLDKLKER